ncbi:MAG: hypothetical protein ACKOAX_02070, partial [Candidatus Kapaibacterium sp.]
RAKSRSTRDARVGNSTPVVAYCDTPCPEDAELSRTLRSRRVGTSRLRSLLDGARFSTALEDLADIAVNVKPSPHPSPKGRGGT